MKPIRALLLHARFPDNETLSYQRVWPRHLAAHPGFRCVSVNVLSPWANRLTRVHTRVAPRRFDAVIILHSVFSNGRFLNGRLLEAIRRLPVPKVYFIGNEYKGMPEKMWFCEVLPVSLLVSQLSSPAAHELYRQRLGCNVLALPNSGLDTELFSPRTAFEDREIDLGYRAHEAPLAIGNAERRALADRFTAAAAGDGLRVDISLDPAERLDERGWARFLDGCKGQLASEAGGDYFELTDETWNAVNAYVKQHPQASFEEVDARFFRDYPAPVSGRALPSRVIEAAGTKTVQILLEGEYGGYFRPDVHYIPLRRDFSNLDEALAKFRDRAFVESLRNTAHEVAVEELRFEKLIDRLHDALAPLV